jgi:hypothetical protein
VYSFFGRPWSLYEIYEKLNEHNSFLERVYEENFEDRFIKKDSKGSFPSIVSRRED